MLALALGLVTYFVKQQQQKEDDQELFDLWSHSSVPVYQ